MLSFLQSYETNPRDRILKDYTLTEHRITGERGAIVSATLTFKGVPGIANGAPRFSKTTIDKSLTTKRITVRAANEKRQQVEITYKAPTTTYSYARASEPTAGRYLNQVKYFKDSFKIINARGYTKFPLSVISPQIAGSISSADVYYVAIAVYTEVLNAKQMGEVWQVEERNDGQFIEVFEGLTNDVGTLTPAGT